jgi:hypothetical protein
MRDESKMYPLPIPNFSQPNYFELILSQLLYLSRRKSSMRSWNASDMTHTKISTDILMLFPHLRDAINNDKAL